jgi:hypothetical protein
MHQNQKIDLENLLEALKSGKPTNNLSSSEREIFSLFDNAKNQMKTNLKGQ